MVVAVAVRGRATTVPVATPASAPAAMTAALLLFADAVRRTLLAIAPRCCCRHRRILVRRGWSRAPAAAGRGYDNTGRQNNGLHRYGWLIPAATLASGAGGAVSRDGSYPRRLSVSTWEWGGRGTKARGAGRGGRRWGWRRGGGLGGDFASGRGADRVHGSREADARTEGEWHDSGGSGGRAEPHWDCYGCRREGCGAGTCTQTIM